MDCDFEDLLLSCRAGPFHPRSIAESWLKPLYRFVIPSRLRSSPGSGRGAGHFYQGRTGKGWLYMTCILSLYFFGFLMGEGKIVYWRWVNPFNNPEQFSLYYIGQFFVGLPALPAFIQGTLTYFGLDLSKFGGIAGFMAPPHPNVLNGLHPRLSKLVEVGTIYTTIAGLLNVLAIYDAFEGPAYADDEAEPAPASKQDAIPDLAGLKAEGDAA